MKTDTKFLKKKDLLFTMAVGTVGKNSNPGPDLGIDLNSTPTIAGQVRWDASEKFQLYLSALTVDTAILGENL